MACVCSEAADLTLSTDRSQRSVKRRDLLSYKSPIGKGKGCRIPHKGGSVKTASNSE